MKKVAIEHEQGFLLIIALAVLGYSLYLAAAFASQPPLDDFSFRQTQTALTSYWFVKQGFKLAYETPVVGAPWAIPFEFPIYQAIVAYFSKTFHWNLDATGRLVSYAFLLLTTIPATGIARQLKLPSATSLYFTTILFSMPIYVYWGRAFMIETAALFFCIAAIKFFLDYLFGKRTILASLAFIVFASLGVLQKATTALPVLLVLAIVFFVVEFKKLGSLKPATLIKNLFVAGFVFLIPVVIGWVWVNFTDQVKLENPVGKQLTSAALFTWNWGTLSERASSEIWSKVVWERIISPNLGALLGTLLLIIPLLVDTESKIKYIMLSAISLGVLPLFLFPHLHLVHSYYQTANALFFAYGVSLSLAATVAPALGKRAAILILAMLVWSNYDVLHNEYLPKIKSSFTKANRDVAIGKILNREVPEGMQFVAFGNDWSSTFAYISERKSFTAPSFFKGYDQVILNPAEFCEQGHLGATVSCTTQKPSAIQVFDWAKNNGSWKVGETHGCLVVTPEKQISNQSDPTQCTGSIDSAVVELREGKEFVVFAGWLVVDNDGRRTPDDVVLKISSKNTAPIFLQALKVPRLDVSHALGIHDDIDAGFSRIIENTFQDGTYDVELGEGVENKFRPCGIHKRFEIRQATK